MEPQERKVKFQETLCELLERSKASVTHKKLGAAIGVSGTTVSHYANGRIKPSFEALVGIAVFFNVPLDYLVFGERPPKRGVDDTESVRAEVQRALAESLSDQGRRRDLIVRINRRLHDEVERVAEELASDRENFGPAGFLTDAEAMAIESCSSHTKVMIKTVPADVVISEDGTPSQGEYFETMRENISLGRMYQFIFYGKRAEFSKYTKIYRDLLQSADVELGLVHENLQFRVIDAELPISVMIHELDTALLERREPVLWERLRDEGITDGTLAYSAVRHLDARGGVVLVGGYFESSLRMFKRDWERAAPL